MILNWKDFNEMTHTKLCSLPGIGKTVADRIIAARPYRMDEDLFKLKGLGKKTLSNLGIQKKTKERRNWIMMEDGIEYPTFALAINTMTNAIDFFWRIPKDKRQYL